MKKSFYYVILAAGMIFTACTSEEKLPTPPAGIYELDCRSEASSFLETLDWVYDKTFNVSEKETDEKPYNDFFLIKGVLRKKYVENNESHPEPYTIPYFYVIEDYKGNLEGKSPVIVWDHWEFGYGVIRGSKDNDTLIVLMKSSYDYADEIGTGELTYHLNGYQTIGCRTSTLKYENGYVTGHINKGGDYNATALWSDVLKDVEKILNEERE
jgi:hypothetical protein